MKYVASFILKLMGWKVIGNAPPDKQYVLVFAPHTTNIDFIIGVLGRTYFGMKTKFVAKDTLFKPPFGWIFKYMGGIPVNRSKSTNFVDKIAKYYEDNENFSVIFAAEGTRQYTDSLKTGFYYLSVKTKAPIWMVGIDYPKKEITINTRFVPGDNPESDFKEMYEYFKQFTGKYPEQTFLNKPRNEAS